MEIIEKSNDDINKRINNNLIEDNNILDLLIKGYEAFRLLDFEKSIEYFKQLLSNVQSKQNLEMTSEVILNLAVLYFYMGKLSKAYHFISEAFDICQALVEKNYNSNLVRRIYIRILCNFVMINISMNLCDNSLSNFDTLIEFLSKLNKNVNTTDTDPLLKYELLDMIIKNFFFCDLLQSKSNGINGINGIDFLLKRLDDKVKFGNEVFLILKSFNILFFGFIQFLKKEKSLDYFTKCQQEAIINLNILNEKYLVSIPLINLSLMKIMKEDAKSSKEIFNDFYKIFKQVEKNEKTTPGNKSLDKSLNSSSSDTNNGIHIKIENTYSKIINEQFQKFETAKIIYENIQRFYNNNKEEDNFDHQLDFKSYLNKNLNMLNTTNTNASINKKEHPKKIIYILILRKLKTQFLNNNEEELIKINLALEILNNNFENFSILKLSDYNEVELYINNLLTNMLIIYKKSKMSKYFKTFLKRTLIYENIKNYRDYLKRTIKEPRIKKYFYKCLDNFKDKGYLVTKFNFSSSGRKEKFMKFHTNEDSKYILFSDNKNFTSNLKKVNIEEISNIVYGVNTLNMKNKFSEFKREIFKKPWLFLSFIIKNKNKLENKIDNKNKFYTSVDLFLQDEADLKEIIFSVNVIKYMFGLKSLKILSNGNFLIQKLKFKMIEASKEKMQISSENKKLLIENCWSFTKLLLYITKNKIRVIE